jgi:hypothetical protein
MSAFEPYAPIDLAKGVYYNVERDDFDNYRHWMTIEGEEIELTQNQYNVLMRQREEFRKSIVEDTEERIIKLIEPLGCEANGVEHDCQNGLGYTTAQDLINLIKGEK